MKLCLLPLGCPAHLLRLQGEFDKDLLQLFVHEVDAELFKAIFLWRKGKGLSVSGLCNVSGKYWVCPSDRQNGLGGGWGVQRQTWKISKP